MPAKRHIITLTCEERASLKKASLSNRRSIREKTRARILLLSDTGVSRKEGGSQPDTEIAVRLKVNPLTVANVRQRAHERGALACLQRQEQQTRKAHKKLSWWLSSVRLLPMVRRSGVCVWCVNA